VATTAYVQGELSGASGGDLVSRLVSSEVSVTGATTATISRMDVCSGFSDYTLTLPAASGNSGKFIGVRITATSLATIDGNASETIDGATTRVMWEGESAILQCDRSNWFKVSGKTRPMRAVLIRVAAQSISTATETQILFDTENMDIGGIGGIATNDRVDIRRAGDYKITGFVRIPNLDLSEENNARIYENGSLIAENRSYSITTDRFVDSERSVMEACAAADTIDLRVLHTEGASQNTFTQEEPLIVEKLITW
jgi:hypothetical protein